MVILNSQAVREAGSMSLMLPAMRSAFEALALGQAIVPERIHLHLPEDKGVALIMPAYVSSESVPPTLATKVFAVMHGNAERGLPSFQGATILLDPETGVCQAVIDAGALTALRTGASCGVATDILSRPESSVLAVFGAGPQALSSLEAILMARPIEKIYVLDRHAARIAAWLSIHRPEVRLVIAPANDMVNSADIVLTATSSTSQLFESEAIKFGTHISALGSFGPAMQELPPELFARARLFVDNPNSVGESGDLMRAQAIGFSSEIGPFHTVGDILTSAVVGRKTSSEITLYKSVGNAIQDAVAAQVVYQDALQRGIGQLVTW